MIERISPLTFGETIKIIESGEKGVVYCCTLNEIMMAAEDGRVRRAMERATLLTPDGMPLVWYLKLKYGKGERVYGPDLLRRVISNQLSENSKKKNEKGERLKVKSKKLKKIKHLFIGDEKNKIFFEKYGEYVVMPFKKMFDKEDYEMAAERIKKYRADIIWVGLGARKQILAADELSEMASGLYITVGAAFDFISGNKKQAPKWMRRIGAEWLFRVLMEPRRLAKRYGEIMVFVVRHFLGKGKGGN